MLLQHAEDFDEVVQLKRHGHGFAVEEMHVAVVAGGLDVGNIVGGHAEKSDGGGDFESFDRIIRLGGGLVMYPFWRFWVHDRFLMYPIWRFWVHDGLVMHPIWRFRVHDSLLICPFVEFRDLCSPRKHLEGVYYGSMCGDDEELEVWLTKSSTRGVFM